MKITLKEQAVILGSTALCTIIASAIFASSDREIANAVIAAGITIGVLVGFGLVLRFRA